MISNLNPERFPKTLKQFLKGEFGLPLDSKREIYIDPDGITVEERNNKMKISGIKENNK